MQKQPRAMEAPGATEQLDQVAPAVLGHLMHVNLHGSPNLSEEF
jgi:hypothetical protein